MENVIVVASGNKGKIKEVEDILKTYTVKSIKEYGIDLEIEEDGKTFLENAEKKANAFARMLNGKICLADDSGIQIEYLNGFPGVNTKRWHTGTDRERNLEILKKLENVSKEKRKVRFVTAIAISNGENTISTEEYIEGYISEEIRGENGFGFDEIFELDNGKTLAELSQEEKNMISARKKALEEIAKKMFFK